MKRIIFWGILFCVPVSYGMQGNDDLYALLRTLGPNGVGQALNTLGRNLTQQEAGLLRAAQEKQKAEAEARRAQHQLSDTQVREQGETQRAQTRVDEARYRANAEQAQLQSAQAERARIQEEKEKNERNHQLDMNRQQQQQQWQKQENDRKARIERENLAEKTRREAEVAQQTADYQDGLARQREADERQRQRQAQQEAIERDKKAQEERLAREQEANATRLQQEVDAAREKAKADAERDKELSEHKIAQWQDPATREALEGMAQQESERRAEENERTTRAKIEEIKQAVFEFTDHPERMKSVSKVAGVTVVATAGGVLTVKHTLPIMRQLVENYLFTPVLIEESSYSMFGSWFSKKKDFEPLKDLYFDNGLQAHVNEIKTTLATTKKNNGYYMNYLFYGPPGTGKTATARALAYESGMDFAFMTGGSVSDLLRSGKAIQRLKEVFGWANKSKKGLILFIDEADAFLGDPNGSMTEELNSVLKAFLNYTGTESKNFSLILSTNHPNQLSKAVLSRIGFRQQIRFDAPAFEARYKIVEHFVTKYLGNSRLVDASVMTTSMINYIAQQTQGFAGRDISYLILGLEKAALATETPIIDRALVEKITNEAVAAYNEAQHFVSYA